MLAYFYILTLLDSCGYIKASCFFERIHMAEPIVPVWHRLSLGEIQAITVKQLRDNLIKAGYGWVLNAQVESKPLVKDLTGQLLAGIVRSQDVGLRCGTQAELQLWSDKHGVPGPTVAFGTVWINLIGRRFFPVRECIDGRCHWTMIHEDTAYDKVHELFFLVVAEPAHREHTEVDT